MKNYSCPPPRSMERTERVAFYEKIFDELCAAEGRAEELTDDRKADLREKKALLEAYYTSGQWRADYEADEAGLLPEGLKRGVLSQDGVYNLLAREQE